MSICNLNKGLYVRLYRQALFLTRCSRMMWSLTPGVGAVRLAHNNSLYQMVKKRTLEARTKLQPNKFSKNQTCVSQHSSDSKNSRSISPSKNSSQNPQKCPIPTISKAFKKPTKDETYVCETQEEMNPCQNREVLKAPDCHVGTKKVPECVTEPEEPSGYISKNKEAFLAACGTKTGKKSICDNKPAKKSVCDAKSVKKSVCAGIKEDGTFGGGDGASGGDGAGGAGDSKKGAQAGGQGSDGMSQNQKILFGVLAALGMGGLLLLLTRGKKKEKSGTDTEQSRSLVPQTIPHSSAELPKHVPYLLIGGGTASFSAFRAIKSNDAKAKVLMINDELRKPYMRPPLSKELWYSAQKMEPTKDYRFKQWTGSERSLFFEPEEFFVHPTKLMENANGGIAVAQGFTVRKVDPNKHIVTLTDGYEISYDECLIATGCSPKNLDVFREAPLSVKDRVMIYRTPDDFERLKQYADQKQSITIVGNGFTGSELACSLANYCKDKKVKIYQVFPENGVMSKVLPDYLSKWTTRKVEEQGVCVLPNAGVQDAKRADTQLQVALNNGTTIMTDIVVVCVGCEPNTKIANISGLEVDKNLGGFVVNAELEARTNLYVAGDASCFYDPLLGRRRVEHHDHSVVSGRLAGENMVGKKKSYTHQSMFWSDLGPEIGYEGIGCVDATLPTVAVFALPSDKVSRNTDNLTETRSEAIESLPNKELPDVRCDPNDNEDYGRGVIFYMKNKKIVGILMWNLFNRIGLARTIINENKEYEDLNEVAKLFEIHS